MSHCGSLNDVVSDINSNKAPKLIPPLSGNGLAKMPKEENDAGSNIIETTSMADERVTFNVGGVIFQTSRTTCRRKPCKRFKLADEEFLEQFYDARRMEYFLDRDPEVFRSILNFWRTGNLHLPLTVCGPYLKDELDFYGLREIDIQPCCWDSYNMWMKTVESLHKLERDRHPSYLNLGDEVKQSKVGKGKWGRVSLKVWKVFTDPSYSRTAKIYAYTSLFFVILAIFSFCASTHSAFQLYDEDDKNATVAKVRDDANYDAQTTVATISRTDDYARPRGKDIITDSNVHPALFYIDVVCLAFFTLEYLIRFVCAPRRCRYVINFSSIVDLLAILPDYLEFLVYNLHSDPEQANAVVEFMPFLRLMRALRIFRLVRRVPGLWIMIYTLRASFKELSLMLVFLLVGTLFFSSVIYFVDDPKIYKSIPHGFWWAIVTMTTVGYGDVTPTTAWGKLVGSITAICGVLLVGFTIPALVNNFITYYQHVEFVIKKERLFSEAVFREQQCLQEAETDDYRNDDDPESRYRLCSTDAILPDGSSVDIGTGAVSVAS